MRAGDTPADRTPYCVAKGCASLPPREHLEAHAHWGCTGPEQTAELIDTFEQHIRTQVAEEIETTAEASRQGLLDRPKAERGLHINDFQWAAAIARQADDTTSKEA